MSFLTDTIKIKYINEGFLPNIPYHEISDMEMIDAFINAHSPITPQSLELEASLKYFDYMYPYDDIIQNNETLKSYWDILYSYIAKVCQAIKDYHSLTGKTFIPSWIASYMLGNVVSPRSVVENRHDLLVLLGRDNIDDVFIEDVYLACYKVSQDWVRKTHTEANFNISSIPSDISEDEFTKLIETECPSIYGALHVVKSLRLSQANQIRYEVK